MTAFSVCDGLFRCVIRRVEEESQRLISVQCSIAHQLLPKHEWTKPADVCQNKQHLPSPNHPHTNSHSSQDYPYLSPIIRAIETEQTERADLESMQITKPKSKN